MTSDPPLESLALPGGAVTFVDEGPKRAPALIALHGVPGSVRDFRHLAPRLTTRLRFVRVDLPGFGGSTATRRGVGTIAGRGDAVLMLADHLGLREFGVLGHSMGGATALHLASHHPQRARALVLVASIALRPHRGLGMSPRIFGLLAHVMRVPGLGRLLLPSVRKRYRRRRFPGVDDMTIRDFAVQFQAVGAGDFAAIRRDLASPLPPTLVAYAEDDALVETAVSEELVGALPHARVLRFAEGGHNIQKTRAPELAAAIVELLGGLMAPPLRETPYWWEGLADALDPADSERPWPARTDVVVIGGGYTGLSAARTLARGGASVVVLERETIGWGASSRNGGQVLTGQKLGTDELLRRFGRERAGAIFGASLAAIDLVERLVAEEGIDCGFVRAGHLEAAFKPAHFDRLRMDQELLAREFGHEVHLIPRAEQEGELGSGFYHGLLLDPKSAGLHPARYVRGLAAAAARAGADLRPRTAVLALRREGTAFVVETARGRLSAQEVLVATNGYTGAATPALRRRIVPVGSYIIATARLPAETARMLLPRRRMVFDSKHFLYYFRLSEDDRLLFGGRAQFTPSTAGSTRTSAEILRRAMVEVFPALRDVPVECAWSGNVAFTMDRLPHAGTLGGLHFAMGCCGHGVGMSTYLGDVMADIVLGRADRNPFRGEPFPAIPLYSGRPWFLPLAGAWYKLLDLIQ